MFNNIKPQNVAQRFLIEYRVVPRKNKKKCCNIVLRAG